MNNDVVFAKTMSDCLQNILVNNEGSLNSTETLKSVQSDEVKNKENITPNVNVCAQVNR